MASKRRIKRAGCRRKRQYTKDQAFAVALTMRDKYPGERLDAYPCANCGHWHVGHRPYKVQQKIAARRRLSE